MQAKYFSTDNLVLTLLFKRIFPFVLLPSVPSRGRDLLWPWKRRVQVTLRKENSKRSRFGLTSSMKMPHASISG